MITVFRLDLSPQAAAHIAENIMRIPVIYQSGQEGNVTPKELDKLIDGKLITRFKRSSGWVEIDRAPVRKTGHQSQVAQNPSEEVAR